MATGSEVYRVDKSAWPDGPWQQEPDHDFFEHAGLPCILHRVDGHGAWCGYVAVPPGHPLHGKGYGDDGVDLCCHGGITYSDKCRGAICHVAKPGEPDDVWWFGFDCAHAGDLCPGHQRERFGMIFSGSEEYRDIDYVRSEVKQLAEQLSAL